MNTTDIAYKLVSKALDEIDNNPEIPLSNVLRKAIRIARLRNDYYNYWWLQYEMLPFDDDGYGQMQVKSEISPHFTKVDFDNIRKIIIEEFIKERRLIEEKDQICALSVAEIENRLSYFQDILDKAITPEGLHPVDLYFVNEENEKIRFIARNSVENMREIIERIKQRIYNFLSITEKQLLNGQFYSDIFKKNCNYVEEKLDTLLPDALQQLLIANKRLMESDSESKSHALLSCRRALKSFADKVYPATSKTVAGSDGKQRKLTEDKYVSRLWQFVHENSKGSKSGNLLLSQINDLGNRIDRVYDLSCKGVHVYDEISDYEANQCLIQTYLLIGDMLRLYDKTSAIGEEMKKE